MEEINFLSNKKDGGRKAEGRKNTEKIEWSKPANIGINEEQAAGKPLGWLSFFKKNKLEAKDKKMLSGFNVSRKQALNSARDRLFAVKQQKKESARQPVLEKKADFNKAGNSPKAAKTAKAAKTIKKQTKQKQEEQEWENPNILETNLIKNEIVSFFDWQKGAISLIIACVLPCFIIAVIYGFLFSWEKKMNYQNQDIVGKINTADQQIKELEMTVKNILFFQKKLKFAAQLLDSHIYWTNFFNFLENYTLENVFYDGFAGDTSGNYSLTAKTKDFWTIAQQIKAMRANNNVSYVNVGGGKSSSGGGDDQTVDFALELSINPEIFTE